MFFQVAMMHTTTPSAPETAAQTDQVLHKEELQPTRKKSKDLAKFLGVEEVPTMERVKGRSLDSSSSDCYSIPSYSGTSNFTSSSSSRTPSMTSSEDQMSTKM